MSKPYPKSLGRGGRRSLSDVQVGRLGESQGRDTRLPTRTVSLATSRTGSNLPLGERVPADFQHLPTSNPRSIPRVETSSTNGHRRAEFHRDYENQPIRAPETTKLPEEGLETQTDPSSERRKENVAPIINYQAWSELPIPTVKEANRPDEVQACNQPIPFPSDSRANLGIAQDPVEVSRGVCDSLNRPVTSLRLPVQENLLPNLQSMYGNISPDLTSNLAFLYAIEDAFDARYTAAFDVFYNARRFFDKPSGTILDSTSNKYPIGSGTLSGKSIYGVFINDYLLYEPKSATRPRQPISPNLPSTGLFNQRAVRPNISGKILTLYAPSQRGLSTKESHMVLVAAGRKFASHQKGLTVPSRRLHRSQLSESVGYSSLPRRRKVVGRDTMMPPIRLRPIFRTSPPRAPSFGMRKKTSTLRPKAVMAWWKEREAATSRVETFGREVPRPLFNEQTKEPPLPKGEPPTNEKGKDKDRDKEKRRNPLRRLSSLFGKRQNSEASLKSMGISNGSQRSLNSLPSQVSLPECRQGLPSFITTNIVRNNRGSTFVGGGIETTRPEKKSEPLSVVQQRISSFEAPVPIQIEKKYQTSPSYQLLSTLKPVRGRSLKEQFEKKLDYGAQDSKSEAIYEGTKTQAREVAPGHALVTPLDTSGYESTIFTRHLPPTLKLSNASGSTHSDGFSITSPPFVENSESEVNGSREIYDGELDLSSPDFSDPQIITSTPLQNSGLGSPLIPPSISIFGDSRLSDNFDYSVDSSINSNHHTIPIASTTIKETKATSNNTLAYKKAIGSSEKKHHSTGSVGSTASDDNKENIAPDIDLPNLPRLSPRNTRRRSGSGILGLFRDEATTQNMGVKFQQRQNRGWQKRPLRMVKSALGPFGTKESSKTVSRDQRGIKKKRQSVLDLFKFSRPTDMTNSTPTPGTSSFRVLPTADSVSMRSDVEVPIHKKKSILSTKLGRKKKPILVVPKYPKKDKSRGNLFGLFEFNKGSPRNSFAIHSDTKEATERKFSIGSNRTLSKTTRRLSVNVFPLFRRRIFSAPPDTQSLPPEPVTVIQGRSISPPPQLELTLSGSGL
ncbi:hypothetical protein TWF718_004785 [Orbilia javanica]|uniref:Uncharacterized protein n=1 Tax=Orbilia javanica TaxID=47235 RepID=A0AAN8N6T1_9PEZI